MGCCTGYNFTPAPDAALAPDQRVNFSFGMVLGVDDFRQEHAYLAGRDERALRELIGYGAISGLDVGTAVTGTQVEVRVLPGLALLPDGKLVAVKTAQCARLDEWLAGPGKPEPTRSGQASVYIVLRHVEVSGTPVPIPGEPCRDESALLADSRIADSFTIDFSWTAPAQAEEDALRTFAAWLARIEIRSAPHPGTPLDVFMAAVESGVTAVLAHAQSVPGTPPLAETPIPDPDPAGPVGSPPGTQLIIPRAHYTSYINAAFDVWVRRLRAGAMARFGPVPAADPAAEAGLLLAAVDLLLDAGNLVFPPAPGVPALARWLGRAQLVHLRLLQQWLISSSADDAPVEADYLLGRADPHLPNAQDLHADFALADHALARVDLVAAPLPGQPAARKAVLRPAVKWPGGVEGGGAPDYYGPRMAAPIPVADGGSGQRDAPAQGQLLVGVAGAGDTPAQFRLGALRPVARVREGEAEALANLTIDVAGAAPQILIDTIQDIGPRDSPLFAGLAVDGEALADSLTLATPLAIGSGGSGQSALPQRLQVLVGERDGDDGRFVLAGLVDSDTVAVTLKQADEGGNWRIAFDAKGSGLTLPLAVQQGGTGQGAAPGLGQILRGDDAGKFAPGNLRQAVRGRHIDVALAGDDLTIDTTPQAHWATRIVDDQRSGLKGDDHVVLLVAQGDDVTFELGEPEDERVVVIKAATKATFARLIRGGRPDERPYIDEAPTFNVGALEAVTLVGSKRLQRWFVIGRV